MWDHITHSKKLIEKNVLGDLAHLSTLVKNSVSISRIYCISEYFSGSNLYLYLSVDVKEM